MKEAGKRIIEERLDDPFAAVGRRRAWLAWISLRS